ncbi:MAG: hypothetical protein AB7P02_04755 [Alphaproteobacteria bacterium]
MSFILYRILGNDLPPRHMPRQTLANLRFVLEHEPPLPGCEKRWVLNRIADPAIEGAARAMIAAAGHRLLHIAFSLDEYAGAAIDHGGPQDEHLHAPAFHALPPERRAIILEWCLRRRTHYLTNVNAARNRALAEGRGVARWTLPWDGSTLLTRAAWDEIRAAADGAGDARYLAVPLLRTGPGGEPLPAAGIGEPQLAFRDDAVESFDTDLRYGYSDKAALLARLGVDGPWSPGEQARIMATKAGPSPDAGRWRWAGAVLRLTSGNDAADEDPRRRVADRVRGLIAFTRAMDERVIARNWSAGQPLFYRRLPQPGSRDMASLLREAAAGGWRGVVAAALAAAGQGASDGAAARRLVAAAHGLLTGRGGGVVSAFAIDAVAAVARAVRADGAAIAGLRAAADRLLTAPADAEGARAAFLSRGVAGTGYELLALSLSAFLGDVGRLRQVLERLPMRVAQQFRPDGSQPDCRGAAAVANLECWGCIAAMARPLGFDAAAVRGDDGPLLQAGLTRAARAPGAPLPRLRAAAYLVVGKRPATMAVGEGVPSLPPFWTAALD